jgi:hypothetical protein
MTTQQIEVLARFDGWEKRSPESTVWVKDSSIMYDEDAEAYLTSPGVLISMRLKLKQKIDYRSMDDALALSELGELILNKEYTAAAIKTSEIIQKLEA